MKELQVTQIVAAYVKRNPIPTSELPALITQVNQALSGLGQAPAEPVTRSPAVSIRRSIGPDKITCLECGHTGSMLKRHLATAHGMTPDEYRAEWRLAKVYPMTASNYSARRSGLAKAAGLGTRSRGRLKRAVR